MFHFTARVVFVIGIVIGTFLAFIVIHFKQKPPQTEREVSPYDIWFDKLGLKRYNHSIDELRYGSKKYTLESQMLFEKIPIQCVILAKESKNVDAARATWAKGCNQVVVVNVEDAKGLVRVKKSKENSRWVRLCRVIRELNDEAYWTVVVYDPTFVIMENLRMLVGPMNHTEGHYLGHAVTFWTSSYNAGRAGYVLSKGALKVLKNSLKKQGGCMAANSFLNKEDFYLGKHLSTLNIHPEDTRDPKGLSTFHNYNWQHEFFPGLNYYKYTIYPVVCCSSRSITFQAIDADKMYMYYYILYRLQVFLKGTLGSKPMAAVPKDLVWKAFLKERGIVTNSISAKEYYRIWEDLVHDPTSFAQQFMTKNETY